MGSRTSIKRLKRLRAVETSFVPFGANKKMFAALKEKSEMAKKNIKELVGKMVLKNDAKITAVLKELSPEDADAIKAALKVIQAMGDQVPPEVAHELMELIGAGGTPPPGAHTPPPATPEQKEMAGAYPAMKERAEKAEGELRILKAAGAEPELPVTKEGDLDLTKIPEHLQPAMKSLWSKNQRLAKVEKTLADERETRVTKEYVEIAGELKHLPVKKELLGKVLKTIASLDPESYTAVHDALKAANAAVEKADPTRELGSSHSRGSAGGGTDPDSVYESDIVAPAMAQIVAKEKGMNKNDAVTHFITKTDEGRKAYRRYNELQQAAARRA